MVTKTLTSPLCFEWCEVPRKKKEKVVVKQAKVLGVKIFCPKLEKEVLLDDSKCYFNGSESECDLCGSHGKFEVNITACECGDSHCIVVSSW